MLLSPCPTNSWLLLSRCPDFCASAREMDMLSTMPMAAMARAPGLSSASRSRSSSGGTVSGGSPRGRAPSTSTPCRVRSIAAVAAAAAAMAIRAAGQRGRHLRSAAISTSVPSPSAALGPWVPPSALATCTTVSRKMGWLFTSSRSRCRSWFTPMSTAAPAVNPTTTESDTKFTSAPMRASPITSLRKPASTARYPAAARNSGVPGVATVSRVASTSRLVALVGPECRCRDEPHSAPATAAVTAVYRPICGGSSAIMA